ncbi:MAG TPA: hypothetical protein VL358_11275 [Caulobacteraceae bacterium]|jgi:hypothetical protein|nr:hypothetical protein [Caulobacteraceae bacterium]
MERLMPTAPAPGGPDVARRTRLFAAGLKIIVFEGGALPGCRITRRILRFRRVSDQRERGSKQSLAQANQRV